MMGKQKGKYYKDLTLKSRVFVSKKLVFFESEGFGTSSYVLVSSTEILWQRNGGRCTMRINLLQRQPVLQKFSTFF